MTKDTAVRQVRTYALAIAGGSSSTGVFASMANPEGVALVILSATLVIGTGSGGASTLDIGVAADATTSSDTLIDGLSGASAGVFSSGDATHRGTNGYPARTWSKTQFVNAAEASGNVDGLVATLYLEVCAA